MVRTLPQNKRFHAMVRDIARAVPLTPWRRALTVEAWKRYFILLYVRETRLEAYANGDPDPFPVRPVPSSALDSRQMADLIESTLAFAAQNLNLILD